MNGEASARSAFAWRLGHETDLRHRHWRRGRSGYCDSGRHLRKDLRRRGLHLNAYNAYQSIIRGGHTFLTIRTSDRSQSRNMGDKTRPADPAQSGHHGSPPALLGAARRALQRRQRSSPGGGGRRAALPLAGQKLARQRRNKLAQNTLALGAALQLIGIGFQAARGRPDRAVQEEGRRGRRRKRRRRPGRLRLRQRAISEPFAWPAADDGRTASGRSTGNTALAMGGAAAGVKFYCAYPDEPVHRRAALDGRARPQGSASWSGRSKTRSA